MSYQRAVIVREFDSFRPPVTGSRSAGRASDRSGLVSGGCHHPGPDLHDL